MGRNGKRPPVFTEMMRFVNEHVGEIVSSEEILLGAEIGRNVNTGYLYKFVKLGYLKPLDNGLVRHKDTKYKIAKAFPPYYNSILLAQDLRAVNGNVPDYNRHIMFMS